VGKYGAELFFFLDGITRLFVLVMPSKKKRSVVTLQKLVREAINFSSEAGPNKKLVSVGCTDNN